MPGYILLIAVALISLLIQSRLKSVFKKYAKIPLGVGLTGKEIAEKMLKDHDIHDVKIISVPGTLTDHYNPKKKTINLSPAVYSGNSISSAAVAAHECGHAVQHAKLYSWLQLRSALVPVISFSSKYVMWVIILGILMLQRFPNLLLAGIGMFALSTLFSFITLPVEYDASKRAVTWLRNNQLAAPGVEQKGVEKALNWAARTYVVAAIGSLATLLYYISIFNSARR